MSKKKRQIALILIIAEFYIKLIDQKDSEDSFTTKDTYKFSLLSFYISYGGLRANPRDLISHNGAFRLDLNRFKKLLPSERLWASMTRLGFLFRVKNAQ